MFILFLFIFFVLNVHFFWVNKSQPFIKNRAKPQTHQISGSKQTKCFQPQFGLGANLCHWAWPFVFNSVDKNRGLVNTPPNICHIHPT